MTLEMWVIAIVRVLGSLPVLRWAFLGGLLAILIDFSDLYLRNLLSLGGVDDYQGFDKYLDQVYMACFLLVTLRWPRIPRDIAIALYAFRLIGFAVFEVTDERWTLLLFPNLFEFWFLFVASLPHWWRSFAYRRWQVIGVLLVLLAAKEFQEYALHGARWLDTFTAVEAVEAIWDWITAPLR